MQNDPCKPLGWGQTPQPRQPPLAAVETAGASPTSLAAPAPAASRRYRLIRCRSETRQCGGYRRRWMAAGEEDHPSQYFGRRPKRDYVDRFGLSGGLSPFIPAPWYAGCGGPCRATFGFRFRMSAILLFKDVNLLCSLHSSRQLLKYVSICDLMFPLDTQGGEPCPFPTPPTPKKNC
jgi:hypothetical protein